MRRRFSVNEPTETLPRSWKTLLSRAVIVIVFALLAYSAYTEWDLLIYYPWQVDPKLVGLAFLFYPVGLALRLAGWHQVIRALHQGPTFRTNARIYCLTSLPRFIPGVVWYLVGRAQMYKETGVSRSVALVGSLLEAILLVITGFLTYMLVLPLSPITLINSALLHIATIVAVVVPLFFLFYPPLFNRLVRWCLRHPVPQATVALSGRDVIGLLVTYVLAWLSGGLLFVIIANAIAPFDIALLPYLVGVWAAAGTASTLASFLIGGLGTGEVTVTLLLLPAVPLPVAVIIALACRVLVTVGEAFWALLAARLLR